jgi:hypothetical protein
MRPDTVEKQGDDEESKESVSWDTGRKGKIKL